MNNFTLVVSKEYCGYNWVAVCKPNKHPVPVYLEEFVYLEEYIKSCCIPSCIKIQFVESKNPLYMLKTYISLQ